MTALTAAQARRIAVAAQGFAEPKPRGPVTRAHLRRLISRIQVLQLDSVSVAVRAHYAPVSAGWARTTATCSTVPRGATPHVHRGCWSNTGRTRPR